MTSDCEIVVRFHEPPTDLRRYFTSFCRSEITCHSGPISDALQPEWGGIRLFEGGLPIATMADGQRVADCAMIVSGPTSGPIDFKLGTTGFWGIGLLPLGWATFMGVGASSWANRIGCGPDEPDFARFLPLRESLRGGPENVSEDLATLAEFFRNRIERHDADEGRIRAVHEMLLDPTLPNVEAMAQACQLTQRTLERTCRKVFGFPPKLLLRRQRFMRSLSAFMLDPSLSWIDAIDSRYFDQSHFVRDCRFFLGMSPSEYVALDHPVLSAFMRERMRERGAAVQTLDQPD